MPEYLSPGVYVEEFESGPRPMEGVSTSTAGFLGYAEKGVIEGLPELVTSFGDFQRKFGGYLPKNLFGNNRFLSYAVEHFFNNGGGRCFIMRVVPPEAKQSKNFKDDDEQSTLRIYAKNPGVWGNKIRITVTPSSKAKTTIEEVIGDADTALQFKVKSSGGFNVGDVVAFFDGVNKIPKQYAIVKDVQDNLITLSEKLLENAGDMIEKTLPPVKILYTCEINLKVSYQEVAEQYENVSLNPSASNYIEKAVSKSSLIVIERNSIGDSIPLHPYQVITNREIMPTERIAVIKVKDGIETEVESGVTELTGEEIVVKRIKAIQLIKESVENTELKRVKEGLKVEITADKKIKVLGDADKELYSGDFSTLKSTEKVEFIIVKDGIETELKEGETALTDEEIVIRKVKTITEVVTEDVLKKVKDGKKLEIIADDEGKTIIVLGENDNELYNEELKYTKELRYSEHTIPLMNGSDGNLSKTTAADFIGQDGGPGKRTGIKAFIDNEDVSIIAMPGIVDPAAQLALVAHCENLGSRFAVLDIPGDKKTVADVESFRNIVDSHYAAMYHPWLQVFDAYEKINTYIPPSGSVMGIYARSDTSRGVHKAPANEVVRACTGLEYQYNTGEQDILNPKGINLIRYFTGEGIRVWGARTCTSNSLWKYINVRRLFIFIEESIKKGTKWVVFEPNDDKLWSRVQRTIENFLTTVWRNGALMGTSPAEAFFVKVDRSTMSQDDIDNGRMICVIGIAPVKPAEFVIFRISQKTGEQQ